MSESGESAPDIAEQGGGGQRSERRLFMQLHAFNHYGRVTRLTSRLRRAGVDAVLYEDAQDPFGYALLTLSEEPAHFVDTVRPALGPMMLQPPYNESTRKPELTMFGRTYAIGYEQDLQHKLITMPRERVLNPDWPWAIWYPLRRSGAFNQLPDNKQKSILKEPGQMGSAFGAADYAHDIRLKSHGLDTHDNDFVIGLVGKELYPLSAVVERMRATEQTSEYLTSLGPFFVGRAIWQSEA